MHFTIEQTHSGLSAKYVIKRDNDVIGSASLGNNLTLGGSIHCDILGRYFSLSLNRVKPLSGLFRKDNGKATCEITENDTVCGKVCLKTSAGSFLSKYDYYSLELNDRNLSMYEVGMGKEGIKYPIWQGEEAQIALFEPTEATHSPPSTGWS